MFDERSEEFRRSQKTNPTVTSQPVLPFSPVIFASFHHGKEEGKKRNGRGVAWRRQYITGFRLGGRNDEVVRNDGNESLEMGNGKCREILGVFGVDIKDFGGDFVGIMADERTHNGFVKWVLLDFLV